MALHVTYRESHLPVELVSHAEGEVGFICKSAYGTFEVLYPLDVNTSFDPQDFSVFYVACSELKENDIYQVYDKERGVRIGWCFPVQALDSTEHSYFDNEYFLRYAYVAATKMLTNFPEDLFSFKPSVEGSGSFKFTDFFPGNVAIFVVSLSTLIQGKEFDLKAYLPSLHKYGYALLSHRDPSDLVPFGLKPDDVRMNLVEISNGIQRKDYIAKAYIDLLPFESDSFVSFFYFYQIFELLITQIFQVEQSALVKELVEASSDSVKTKEILKKSNDLSSELTRMKLLFDKYTDSKVNLGNIMESSNNLLEVTGKNHEVNPVKSFYIVRNILFHQYRDVMRMDLLKLIIDDMPIFLEEVLHFYKQVDIKTDECNAVVDVII